MTWHICRDSKQYGPISEDQLLRLVGLGRVREHDLLWRVGMPTWQPAGEIPGLLTPPKFPEHLEYQVAGVDITHVTATDPQFVASAGGLPKSAKAEVAKAGAWRRYFARMIDVYFSMIVVSMVIGIASAFLSPALFEVITNPDTNPYLVGIFFLPLAMGVDALLYGAFGNTLGKAILAVKVLAVNGDRPTPKQYARRNLSVWASGLGVGFPLVTLITLLYQANRVGKGSAASYDEGKFNVLASRLEWWRAIVAALVFSTLFVLMILPG